MKQSLETTYDAASHVVTIEDDTLQGFSRDFTLRKAKDEAAANDGSHLLRKDWQRFIGPIDAFGGCNPYQGNFTSLALPYTQRERISICAYFIECMCVCFAVGLVLITGDRCLLVR
jgi:ophiobolin F synthase